MEQGKLRMSWISAIPLDLGNTFYTWGWRASIAGGIVTAIALVCLFLGTRVRDLAAERAVTQLRSDLARERAERLPRHVTPEQKQVLVELLSPARIVKGPVLINAAFDGEAWQFGNEISDALKAAGFSPSDVPFGQRAIAFSKPGTFIWIKDMKHQPKHGGPIAVAFDRVGIKLVGEEHPANDDVPDGNTVVIAISTHP
jgi:hypothetical protein